MLGITLRAYARASPRLLRSTTLRVSRRTALPYAYATPIHSQRWYSEATKQDPTKPTESEDAKSIESSTTESSARSKKESAGGKYNLYGDEWEDSVDFAIKSFEDLPHRLFGVNQHMIINYELKEALRIMLRQFNAPIVYCFAYGSGVFPQDDQSRSISESDFRAVHPKPPPSLVKAQKGSPKMIDFIFGVTHTQHWHSINMRQHRSHYSGIAWFGSGLVSSVQDWGAGVYFNPYIEMNGMLIKYGVTSIDNLVRDLSTWDNLYLAGRLQKPVKILRDHPRVRLANQHNLIAALRTAMLLLPPDFTESQLYGTISSLSYMGDPRMALPTENKSKVTNIVDNNMVHFRRLYAPLVKTLPNVAFTGQCRLDDENWVLDDGSDNKLCQDMDPIKRGNMVRRLPKSFQSRLYFQYQKKFAIPRGEFNKMMQATADEAALSTSSKRRLGGEFEQRIARDDPKELQALVRQVVKQTVNWPSTVQSIKGSIMGGWGRTIRYMREKMQKYKEGKEKAKEKARAAAQAAREVKEKEEEK